MTDLLVDTSVLVPLLLAAHTAHGVVQRALGERTVALAGQALHETYSVFTRLPGDARLAPDDAVHLIKERFEQAVVLDARSSRSAPAVLAACGVSGAATYDGLIAVAARSAGLPLASRDRRALSTYARVGAATELIG